MSDNIQNVKNSSDSDKPPIEVQEAKVEENLTADSPERKRETTRSLIAVIYIYAFFGTIAFTFIIGLIKCFEVKDYIDFLIAVSGVLSGPLGFIIGYYFKASDKN